ncbi:unnamed protein product [Phaedon cochleariae]|uniref:PEHE domain-containing protein n=1 Tax=Phaedon cochleariae TaxID=80249 RepID=A0A9P0DGL6_PHACE|nr:unnamed protein product [Phaedon cochleariae]
MGLRTASVRHSHVVVMAPALTETVQTQNFDLPPKSCLEPAYPINSFTKNKFEVNKQLFSKDRGEDVQEYPLNSSEINNTASIIKDKLLEKYWDKIVTASEIDNLPASNINMNVSPSSMGDQGNKMGLQNTDLNISLMSRDKSSNDMEQLLQNLNSVLPDAEGVTTGDVEDIMQVIKSIEGSEQLNNSANDLNSEGEEIFPIGGADLTNNLSSFEKELLENVDVMNMTIEDQQDELDSVVIQKESQAKEVLVALQKKHAKVERRLDFLRRRVCKLQSRYLGQHVATEIAGVFENVNRTLKKPKDSYEDSLFTGSILHNRDLMQLKPMSYSSAKTMVKKLEMSKILQANNNARQKSAPKYFGSGSIEVPIPRSTTSGAVNITPWPIETKSELQRVVGQLKTQTSLTQRDIDSEATESSSGGESCDEMISYNNPHQQYLSIQKRALWKYSTDRAVIAARWTWLQAQIADLEYRIRQHTDLHKQIKNNKKAVQLGGISPEHPANSSVQTAINGYRGQLPGSSSTPKTTTDGATPEAASPPDYQCARTRPLAQFKKRKLLQVAGLHAVSRKAARPSSTRCACVPLALPPCALCTGRTDPQHPRDPPDTMSRRERVALLDAGFHPVFSMPEDTSQGIHLEALMKTQDWQQRSSRMKTYKLSKPDRLESKSLDHRTRKLEHRKKYGRLLKPSTISALSAKIRNKIRGRKPGRPSFFNRVHLKRHANKEQEAHTISHPALPDCVDEEVESIGTNSNYCLRSMDSPCSSPLLHMHSIAGKKNKGGQSYDIDNIVIPYSVAASTRVEKLQYKEILTPKWRIAETDCNIAGYDSINNGAAKDFDQDSDTEDTSEEAVLARHDRSEYDEKKRFLSYLKMPPGGQTTRGRSHRRTDSRAESSEANTPDPMSPHPHNPNSASAASIDQSGELGSPPATPMAVEGEGGGATLPSVAVMRRRTMSQSRFAKEKEAREESRCATPDLVEVPPYEARTFPIDDATYSQMLDHMPENHSRCRTNARSQDARAVCPTADERLSSYGAGSEERAERAGSPDSESTESAAREESRCATPDLIEVPPYEARTFPIDDATYSQMLDHMPENHSRCRTNARSQDARAVCPTADERLSSYGAGSEERAERAGSPDSESTESAVGDGEVEEDEEEEEEEEEEDPNDPEWMDVEQRVGKDRYKR